MNLIENLKSTFPDLNRIPISAETQAMSDALNSAINQHIVAFTPGGFGATFTLNLLPKQQANPMVLAMSVSLVAVDVIISAGVAALATPATNTPPLAWISVSPGILTIPPPPPFILGIQGVLFWSCVLRTIQQAIPGVTSN